jgi:acylphosphatase
MNEIITRHLLIRGRVQGVGFRNYLVYKANTLAIRGWVRNRKDGSVEAVVQGTRSAVTTIIECAQRGPRAAHVDLVEVHERTDVEAAADADFADGCSTLEIRPTI